MQTLLSANPHVWNAFIFWDDDEDGHKNPDLYIVSKMIEQEEDWGF